MGNAIEADARRTISQAICRECGQPATNLTRENYLKKTPLCDAHERERVADAAAQHAAYIARIRQKPEEERTEMDRAMLQFFESGST